MTNPSRRTQETVQSRIHGVPPPSWCWDAAAENNNDGREAHTHWPQAMAASHIALRARSYGSFPVSADEHDKIWLQHSSERIASRRLLMSAKSMALAFPRFLDAFPVLRDASHHLRQLIMGAVALKQFANGDTMSDSDSPALVFLLSGEARIENGCTVHPGDAFGQQLLWGAERPILITASRTCTALVMATADIMALREALADHFVEFDKLLTLQRYWHAGECGDKGFSAEEVKDVVRCLVDAARKDDSVSFFVFCPFLFLLCQCYYDDVCVWACGQFTVRKVARDRNALLDMNDISAIEGGALHIAAVQKNQSCLDALLELDASPNARSGSGLTPVHSAALVGDEAVMQKLLDSKGSPNFSCGRLRVPLHVAAQEVII